MCRRASARFALQSDLAAVPFDDLVDDRETEARSDGRVVK